MIQDPVTNRVKTVTYGTEPVSFVGPKLLWELVLLDITSCHTLEKF